MWGLCDGWIFKQNIYCSGSLKIKLCQKIPKHQNLFNTLNDDLDICFQIIFHSIIGQRFHIFVIPCMILGEKIFNENFGHKIIVLNQISITYARVSNTFFRTCFAYIFVVTQFCVERKLFCYGLLIKLIARWYRPPSPRR